MPPHSIDLRRGRVSEPGRVFLITTVTHRRARLFDDFHLARLTIAHLRRADQLGHAATLAWVLMPDHLHWLVRLEAGTLSALVGAFKAGSSAAINRSLQTPATRRWAAGFHDHALRKEEDLHALARYVVANPLRAGLVPSVRMYPHWDAVWL
ncbi:transposase [Thauera mechernichensis]|uniref:Transposase n=1 Tax=Thauera mechernichensis TaxID=82788 RepID=A0ABW3WAW5_9RHOO|nr:transposase [Thauera mechernichensis]MDG3063498.1 transposase [Thauera mechernichensis]